MFRLSAISVATIHTCRVYLQVLCRDYSYCHDGTGYLESR